MRLSLPNNIFARILSDYLPAELFSNVDFGQSAVIAKELREEKSDIALIPSCDLIQNNDLFISEKLALSFDGGVSNSFLYFGSEDLADLNLIGDVSANEIILSKILFKEKYGKEAKMTLDVSNSFKENLNYLLVGDQNFKDNKYEKGLSFSDEISTLLFLPYVNYVFASKEPGMLTQTLDTIKDIDKKIEDGLEVSIAKLQIPDNVRLFLKDNFNSLYFEMTDVEKEGLVELLKLPFYHGIAKDLFEIKFA